MRIAVVGGPRTGKSTLSRRMSATSERPCPVMCTDPRGLVKDLEPGVEYVPDSHQEWSAASQYVADVFLERPGPWVLDGVGVPRALRKWRSAHPGQPPPVDRVIVMTTPHVDLLDGQKRMTDGVLTVMEELLGWLGDRVEWRTDQTVTVGRRTPREGQGSAPPRKKAAAAGLRIWRSERLPGSF